MRTNRVILFLLAVLLIAAVPASAQWIPCLGDPATAGGAWTAPDLPTIPELVSTGGKLHATVVLTDEQQRLTFKTPPNAAPADNNVIKCAPQYVRVFKGIGAMPPIPKTTGDYPDPMPGPTLRARLGDMIELTFLNQINPANFGDSIDRGDVNTGSGCDESSNGYPNKAGGGKDTYPDCFHGSSTANIHFHGTHTNPNSTGDNVFIEIRPSMRTGGKPVVTAASVATPFSDFFQRCERELGANVLSLWPHTWSDLPSAYTTRQKELLQKYDMTPNIKKLWPVDAAQIKRGDWPQYYMGAYPYCYQIPKYTETVFPPPAPVTEHGGHTGGPLSPPPQKPLQMGQSPGLHWYHAHKHGSTAIDVGNGMTGAFVIEGQYDDDFDKFYGAGWTRRQPVLVINQIGVTPNLERGSGGTNRVDKGPDFSVNGRLRPVMKMAPGEVKLWRIVNTSGRAGTHIMGMYTQAGQPAVDGSGKPLFTYYQTAQDGVQFSPTNFGSPGFTNNQFLLAAGNRADLLIQAPLTAGVYNLMAKNEVDPSDLPGQNLVTLFTVNVTGTAATGTAAQLSPAPTFPPFLHDIQKAEVKGTKEVTFSTGPTFGEHRINHKKFDGEVGELVLLNTVEEWKVVNETFGPAISHPFHIHINPFQVTEVFDPNAALSSTAGPGTLTATGTTAITGSGTSFGTLRTGTVLSIPGQGFYTVLSVQSETALTLTGNGPTVTGSAYSINVPQYVFVNSPAPLPGQCYLNPLDSSTWKPCSSVPEPPAAQPPSSTNNIWWDVFPIPSGITVTWANTATQKIPGYFKLRSRFVDYSGYYVIHCHILAHEDRGMMTVVEVAPAASPYSHD
ncbi:MAG TPA: multicopper oxidase domain-containing protein [Thermoanaerobaculia bacterium]|jgi:FtsP/CotA-like multicopper oxidase with cupredoxin domain|nr:multicopper oxidase domain-containing protein [Thermoanaerobaculia bacterium]